MRQGDRRDAILHSVGANATHGLRRTNADKRRAVSILLQDELVAVDPATGDPWSDREVALRCVVTHPFVAGLSSSLVTDTSEPTTCTYRDRHGNVTRWTPRGSAGVRPSTRYACPPAHQARELEHRSSSTTAVAAHLVEIVMPLSSRLVLISGVVAPAGAMLVGVYVALVSLALPMHFV